MYFQNGGNSARIRDATLWSSGIGLWPLRNAGRLKITSWTIPYFSAASALALLQAFGGTPRSKSPYRVHPSKQPEWHIGRMELGIQERTFHREIILAEEGNECRGSSHPCSRHKGIHHEGIVSEFLIREHRPTSGRGYWLRCFSWSVSDALHLLQLLVRTNIMDIKTFAWDIKVIRIDNPISIDRNHRNTYIPIPRNIMLSYW